MKPFLLVLAASLLPGCCLASSSYTVRLADASAVYLTPDQFPVKGDGQADDSAAVQAAIDRVQETRGEGIVFVPQGRYRITRTIYLWPGVRVIGYGAERPVFVLAPNTPGYEKDIAYMFFFAGARPHGSAMETRRAYLTPPTPPGVVPPGRAVPDANPGTFYSAMSNVDFEIGAGNAGAVAVRFHAAQHAFLSHIDFHTGSGFAGSTRWRTRRRICVSSAAATGLWRASHRPPGSSRSSTRPSRGSAKRRSARTKPD